MTFINISVCGAEYRRQILAAAETFTIYISYLHFARTHWSLFHHPSHLTQRGHSVPVFLMCRIRWLWDADYAFYTHAGAAHQAAAATMPDDDRTFYFATKTSTR